MNDDSVCRFCQKQDVLCESHIVPKFIFRYFKKTSVTGRIRSSENINKPVQDGIKMKYLCGNCESQFSKYEKYFNDNVFNKVDNKNIQYNHILLLFACSVAWRVLYYYSDQNLMGEIDQKLVDEALDVWKNFISGDIENPGKFEQHLYLLPHEIVESPLKLSSYTHRYLDREIEIDVLNSENVCLVYIKLPSILMIGYLKLPNSRNWRESRIKVKNGFLSDTKAFPIELWSEIKTKADKCKEYQNSISEAQQRAINEKYRGNIEKARESDAFKALGKDVKLFGEDDAFNKPNQNEE